MKLVFDLSQFAKGKSHGFEEVNCNILDYIVANREEVIADEIIIVCPKGESDFFLNRYGNQFLYYEIEAKTYLRRLISSARVPSELKLAKDDLVFYPGNTLPLFGGRCKKLLTVHDLLYRHGEFCSKTLHFKLFRLHKYIYIPSSLKRADLIIADSECTKNEIIEAYHTDPDKINVVYLYCNFDKYSKDGGRTIEDLSYPFFLSVCSSQKHKNHTIIIKAFREAAKKDETIHFVLVGALHPDAEPEYEALDKNIKERFHILSNLSYSDLAYLYSNARAYVSASRYEGFGFPVVEALFFGCTCYLSDLGIHREVSFNSSSYFDVDDWQTLAKYMLEHKQGENYHQRVIDTFSPSNTIGKYIEAFNTLLSSKSV